MIVRPRSHRHLLLRGGTVVAMDAAYSVTRADVLVTDGRIAAVGPDLDPPPATRLLDATGLHVLPGMIQGHLHLGQSLFKGLAEGRELLAWLRDRVWPLEAAHDEESAYWSGILGAADCLLSGATTVHDIGVARGMEGIYRAVRDTGLRAVLGKCLMDDGEGVPPALREETRFALDEARALHLRWAGTENGRIRGAVCPRFILSCSPALWNGVVRLSGELDLPIHTHLLESPDEEMVTRAVHGLGQMEFLDRHGVLDRPLRIAHGVWFGDGEAEVLAGRALSVVHCPSANLKLGSGIADVAGLRARDNVTVGVGCDGAACNNDLDILEEMRLAALLASGRFGPGRLSARDALALATCEGARAIGLEREIGSIESGKAADLVLLDLDRPASFGAEGVSVYDRIVYGAGRDAVRWVVVDGEIVVERGRLPFFPDVEAVTRRPAEEIRRLLRRAELS